MWTTVVAAVLLGLGWLVFESGLLDRWTQQSPAASSGPAAEQLAELRVAPQGSMDGYSRARFHHWIAQPKAGRNCNTREAVLARDGQGVHVDNRCQATSGSWTSVYTGQRIDNPSDIDIDHMVPLANAWRSGASAWTDERRERFANDMDVPQLVAVDSSSNRSKGDQDPSQWKPAARDQWCEYATDWVTVKHAYGLTVTAPEKSALQEMLGTCG
ncbi:HNH endonuclease family protein [Saccharopolyspora rosea]